MVMGNSLRDRDVQYVASKDETTHTWRILNTWSDELKTLGVEDDVPDDNSAVTVLTEGEFISLIREAARLGVLEHASFNGNTDIDTSEFDIIISDQEKEIKMLKSQLGHTTDHSEDYDLKEKAMDSIIKLVSLQDVANLSKD
tara:strand:+ start:91 stop:516 length:426 start_codon:yes stop_codon:yes gene_type:complete